MSYKKILRRRAIKNLSPSLLNDFSVYDVIKNPISSEKSVKQMSEFNAYHFAVDMRANKNDIKFAVKALYGVSPKSVTTSRLPHKWRRNRKTVRRPFKKAIVVLKKGDNILFS